MITRKVKRALTFEFSIPKNARFPETIFSSRSQSVVLLQTIETNFTSSLSTGKYQNQQHPSDIEKIYKKTQLHQNRNQNDSANASKLFPVI